MNKKVYVLIGLVILAGVVWMYIWQTCAGFIIYDVPDGGGIDLCMPPWGGFRYLNN